MKVVGIIAEYNPFHNGHKYQIEELKRQTGADYCVIAMSGNFLQRGVPAICNKYDRARMALCCGADLVLEIPTVWATASAEVFAKGGIELLASTGVVTHLGFGAETDDLELLQSIATVLVQEPEEYRLALRHALRKGYSFPVARKQVLLTILEEVDGAYLEEVLNSPNNILAIEYLKALPENITPVLIPRKGAGYHDTDIAQDLPSASAIRSVLSGNKDSQEEVTRITNALANAMPPEALTVFTDCIRRDAILTPEDLSDIMGYRLLSMANHEYSLYSDCTTELANSIIKHLPEYKDFPSFCLALKTKNYTYTRISRVLIHMLLGIKESDFVIARGCDYCSYLRILGFRQDSTDLLSAIKKEASVPLISKVADYKSHFRGYANDKMEQDLHASAIYHQLLTTKKGLAPTNDYSQQIVII